MQKESQVTIIEVKRWKSGLILWCAWIVYGRLALQNKWFIHFFGKFSFLCVNVREFFRDWVASARVSAFYVCLQLVFMYGVLVFFYLGWLGLFRRESLEHVSNWCFKHLIFCCCCWCICVIISAEQWYSCSIEYSIRIFNASFMWLWAVHFWISSWRDFCVRIFKLWKYLPFWHAIL